MPTQVLAQTPARLGYRMPAEWEPHEATWLSWPHQRESWPGKFEPIPDVWSRLTRTLAQVERVHVLASGEALAEARRLVGGLPNVELHDVPTNDAWIRDHGPTFLIGNATPALVDWGYNAWGGKYPPFDLDDQVPGRVAEIARRARFVPGIVLEGGAIDVNGRGTLITSEQCLLNPNRNPGLGRDAIERYLADYLSVRHVIWLGEGIAGDDTDGHVDELARFVNQRVVVAAWEPDPADENHRPLSDNLNRLAHATDQDGRPLEIVRLRMPRALHHNGQRLPASYCNFYVANGLVVVPQFDDPADLEACQTMQRVFPDRRIVGLPARDLCWGLGAYHCITQQEPRLSPSGT